MGKILYHGTNESAGKAILKDGFIDPKGTEIKYGDRKSSLRPQAGKVYMSHSIEYATIYAIGANMIGNEALPSEQDIEKKMEDIAIFLNFIRQSSNNWHKSKSNSYFKKNSH